MANPKVIKRRALDTSALVGFIISLIILLASITSSYFSISGINTQQQELDNLQQEINQKLIPNLVASENKCLTLSRLVGWRTENKWLEDKGSLTDPTSLENTLNKWVKTLKEQYQVDKYGLWAKSEDNTKKSLNIKVLLDGELKRLIDTYQSEIQSLLTQRTEFWQKELTLVGTQNEKGDLIKLEEGKNQEINTLRNDCAEATIQISEMIKRGESEIESLNTQIKQMSEETTRIIKDNELALTKLEQEKKDYDERLQKIQQRVELAKEGLEQDGEIIVSDSKNNYVYLNLGRKDAVFAGMEFEVFTILKGGLKKEKGKVTISKVYDNYSECTITAQPADPLDHIAVDDYVNCRIYSRNKAKKFIFAGKPIGRYPSTELKKKIEEFGGQVLDEVSADIAYLIVGTNYEKDPIYEKAFYLGIVVLREKELYDLLGLTWQ